MYVYNTRDIPSDDVGNVIAIQNAIKFNGGGHINHSIFWNNLSPQGGGLPDGITHTHTHHIHCNGPPPLECIYIPLYALLLSMYIHCVLSVYITGIMLVGL